MPAFVHVAAWRRLATLCSSPSRSSRYSATLAAVSCPTGAARRRSGCGPHRYRRTPDRATTQPTRMLVLSQAHRALQYLPHVCVCVCARRSHVGSRACESPPAKTRAGVSAPLCLRFAWAPVQRFLASRSFLVSHSRARRRKMSGLARLSCWAGDG